MTVRLATKTCARCGKRVHSGNWVYSRHTSQHYCRDIGACAARAKRKRRS